MIISRSLLAFCLLFVSPHGFSFTNPPPFSLPVHDPSVGAIDGEHNVAPDGSANYSIPIAVPPGTAGLQPELSLNYNSNAGNELLGVGWSLGGLSKIHRCGTTLARDGYIDGVDFDGNDQFCLDGQRLVLVDGTHGANGAEYRTENESFRQLIFHNPSSDSAGSLTCSTYFSTKSRDRRTSFYGNTGDSCAEANGANAGVVNTWAINRIEDKFTNYMTFSYQENTANGMHRIERIDYTGNATVTPYNSIEVSYEALPYSGEQTFFTSGSTATIDKRIASIASFSGPVGSSVLVTNYQFEYSEISASNRSHLSSIEQCSGSGPCLGNLLLNWKPEGGADFNNYSRWTTSYGSTWGIPANYSTIAYPDINGDGVSDICGRASSGIVCATSDGSNFVNYSMWTSNYGYTWDVPEHYSTIRFPDINADGLADICGRASAGIVCAINNGSAFVNFSIWTSVYGAGWQAEQHYSTINYVDVNGDGYADICGRAVGGIYCGINNGGAGFNYHTLWTTGYGAGWGSAQNYSTITFLDINSDGLTDVCGRADDGIYCALSDGVSNFANYAQWTSDYSSAQGWWTAQHYSTIGYTDINGDGLPDVCGRASTGIYCGINNGKNGFGTYAQWTSAYGASWGSAQNYSTIQYLDIDADGLGDVCARAGSGIYCARSNGVDSFSVYSAWSTSYGPGWSAAQHYATIRFPDVDGDGLADVCGRAGDGIWCGLNSRNIDSQLTLVSNPLGLHTEFIYESLADKSLADFYSKTNTLSVAYPAKSTQPAQYAVSETRVSNGIGGTFTTSYRYAGLKHHLRGLGSLGFAEMTARNEDTGIETTTYYNQNYSNHTQGAIDRVVTQHDDGTVLSDASNMWSVEVDDAGSSGERYRRHLDGIDRVKRDLNGAFLSREVVSYSYDSYDNLLHSDDVLFDELGGLVRNKSTSNIYVAPDTSSWLIGLLDSSVVEATVSGKPTVTRKSAWQYTLGTGRKIAEQVIDPDSELVVQETRYEDVDSFGNHRTIVVSGDGFMSRDSHLTYDLTGRYILTSTNAKGHVTTNTYYGFDGPLFVGHVNDGKIDRSIDPNGIVTKYDYDAFGRLVKTTRGLGTSQPVSKYTAYQWCDEITDGMPCIDPLHDDPSIADPRFRISRVADGGAGSHVYIDLLGREVKRATQSMDGRFVVVGNGYDAKGNNAKVCEPHFDDAPGNEHYFSEMDYDDLGRAVRSRNPYPDSQNSSNTIMIESTVDFNGLQRTSRNDIYGLDQSKVELRDTMNNLIQVTDNNGQVLSYAYDSAASMVEAVDADNNVTEITFDSLGRKKSINDPDRGLSTFAYNGLGEVIGQINANGDAICMRYDKLGRMTKRFTHLLQDPAQCATAYNATNSHWFYDTAAGAGIGKLAGSRISWSAGWWGGGSYADTSYAYDDYGNTVSTVFRGDNYSERYTTTMTYDVLHRLDTLRYPAPKGQQGVAVKTIYNALGFAMETRDADNDDLYRAIVEVDALGNVVQEQFGNGVETYRGFDSRTRHPEFIQSWRATDVSSPSVQDIDFSFDTVGNLFARNDHLHTVFETFSYDGMNRLVNADVDLGNGDVRNTSVSYDALGNILNKTGIGSYTYGAACNSIVAGPHAVTSITSPKSAVYCYDENGNMLSGDGRSIQYSYFDKPVSIVRGDAKTTLKYGPDYSRYKRIDERGGETTRHTYVGPYEKIVMPNGDIEERHAIGRYALVTIKNRNQSAAGTRSTHYLHQDHLGSLTASTDATTGAVVEQFSFDPWGKRRAIDLTTLESLVGSSWASMLGFEQWNTTLSALQLGSVLTNRGYTGHEQLDGVELIHMGGRVYDPAIGRFLSADPFVQDGSNQQGLNRYSYVENNPLSYTDPSGYFLKKAWKKLKKAIKKVNHIRLKSHDFSLGYQINKKASNEVIRTHFRIHGFNAKNSPRIRAVDNYLADHRWLQAVATIVAGYFGGSEGVAAAAAHIAYAKGASTNDIRRAATTAYIGSVATSGISGHYGNSWSWQRAFVSSTASGVASAAQGGAFRDGFKQGVVLSTLTYAATTMRSDMIDQSRINPLNASGKSVGFRGDGFKLGGGRFNALCGNYCQPSPLGGLQGGQGRLGIPFTNIGWDYAPGSWQDYMVEAYAGPHDYLNSGYWYNSAGNIRNVTAAGKVFGEALNLANVFVATPIVAASIAQPHLMAYSNAQRH